MNNRLKKDPYADFRSHLVQKALEKKKRMEMEEIQEAACKSSALQALQCYSSDTSTSKSGLWSDSEHSWEKVGETSKTGQNQQPLHLLSKEFVSFPSVKKPTNELETNTSHLQPSRIPSPPFLLDQIENEDEFLYGKCDSSPVYQTQTSSVNSCPVDQSLLPKKTESSGWSDDDFLPMQSDCSKIKTGFAHDQENVTTKDSKFSNPVWKKYEQTESNIAGVSNVGSTFDVPEGNSPEFLKSRFSCNQELNRTQPHVSKSEKENDFFGLIPSSVSSPNPSVPNIASLLKNLKQIQKLGNQNVESEAFHRAQIIDDISNKLASQPFIPIKNQITLNLKNKTPSSTSDTKILLTQKESTSKPQVSKTMVNQGAYNNQRTAALLVSQLLQKLSQKQGNREICKKVKCVSKPVSDAQTGSTDNSNQGEPYEKESSSVFGTKKSESGSLQEFSLSRSRKRNISSDRPVLECSKKSKGVESVTKKHWSQSNNDEQSYEASKHSKNSLKKESINTKEGTIRGILKVKAEDLGPEELSFDKDYNENSSDTSPARFDKNLREKSYDMCSRRWSRSPKRRSPSKSSRRRSPSKSPRRRSPSKSPRRRSPSKSPRRRSSSQSPWTRSSSQSPWTRSSSQSPWTRSPSQSPWTRSPSQSPRRRSPSRSPRKRSRSHKRKSSDRSPKSRSRSCKRRSHDRSPRKKSLGRNLRHRSCNRRHKSNDRSPEKRSYDRSPQKGSHGDGPRKLLPNYSSSFSLAKNSEIKTEVSTVSKHLLPESNPDRSLCNESLSLKLFDQRCDKSLQIHRKKKGVFGRDNSQILKASISDSICSEGLLRKEDYNENAKSSTRRKHSAVTPFISKEIKTKLDSVASAEILTLQPKGEHSDGKSIDFNQCSKRKTVKKLPKTEPISTVLKTHKLTDPVSVSSEDVTSSHPVQPEPIQLAPSSALVVPESYAQYSGPSAQNYQTAYQPSPYNTEGADPSTYSYYMNTLPYTSYSGYDPSSYSMYTSPYPLENHLQQRVGYSDYYVDTPVTQSRIPVINPTAALEEKHASKKAIPKKEFRRTAVLVQVDSSVHDSFKRSEDKTEKKDTSETEKRGKSERSESKIEKRDKSDSKTEKRDRNENKIEKHKSESKSEKKEISGGKTEKERDQDETRRDRNKDKIDVKDTSEDRTEKKSKCKTVKEVGEGVLSENNDKAPSDDTVTSVEEKELLSRKTEMKKQIENLNIQYVRMSKLQGEMLRKMRRKKDSYKDYVITAYGTLQDEIKVQLTHLMNAVRDIDKELENKVETVRPSASRTDVPKKSHMAEKATKGKFVSTMMEVIPENAEFYDPGGHWCQNCNKLTTSVRDMLVHLKSEEHKEHTDPVDKPWFNKSLRKVRNRSEVDINNSYPVKGLQFVMPADGFFCSLCKLTFPDSAAVEDHIVGKEHNAAYKKLIAENPLYERRRILDKINGFAVIQKEENKRRAEAEKELANKRKKQEEEINKRKEASRQKEGEKQTYDKSYGKNKEEEKQTYDKPRGKSKEVDSVVSSKTDSETERKNAIKMALLESKKSKFGSRSTDSGKPKQTVVYIGRAPNYKPRTLENLASKSCRDSSCNTEVKKDTWLRKKPLVTKTIGYNHNQRERKQDDNYNKDSSVNLSPENNIFQKVTAKDETSTKNLLVVKSHNVASNQEADNCDSHKNLNHKSNNSHENAAEAVSVTASTQNPVGHNSPGTIYSTSSFVPTPTVKQNFDTSTGQTGDNSKVKEVCSQNVATDVSMTGKADRIAALTRSSPKSVAICDSSHDELSSCVKNLEPPSSVMEPNGSINSATKMCRGSTLSKGKETKKRAVLFPLTEEETDLLLLGINKDDQLPLAIPKPPPSVIASKSNVVSSTEGTDTQQDISQAKCTSSRAGESTSTPCNNKNNTLQQDNPSKSKEDSIFLEELARKAKEYAENSSTQSSLTYHQSLQQSLPYFPYQMFYYYPTTENVHDAQQITAQPSSVSFSGAVYGGSPAGNSYSSVVSETSTIPNFTKTQASAFLSATEHSPVTSSQDQISLYSPSFHITTATVQANALQKSNTATVQAIVSQKTSITSIESSIPQKPSISTVESNILESPQSSTPSVCTQSSPVLQSSILHLPSVSCVKMQSDFLVPSSVTYTAHAKTNLITSTSVLEKPCTILPEIKSILKGQETASCGTVFSPVLPSKHANIGNALQPSQENTEGSTERPLTNNCPSKGFNNIDVQCNVSLAPPGMDDANEENLPVIQHSSSLQLEFIPNNHTASTIPASFPAALPARTDIDTQTSLGNKQNVSDQLLTSYSADVRTNTILPGNVSQPLPVAVQRDAPHFPVSLCSAPSNSSMPESVLTTQQDYLRQSALVIQRSVSQQSPVSCNPAIPGIPSQESIPRQSLILYPPNFRGNSVVVGNMSHPPPNIRPYGIQYGPVVPGNILQQPPSVNLQAGHCGPTVLGDVSQPPPNMNYPQNQLAHIPHGDVPKPPPHVSNFGNNCVPPAPGTVLNSPLNISCPGNQYGSTMLSSVSHPLPNVYLPGNVKTSPVVGNISQPPPIISCTGTSHAPPVLKSASQPQPSTDYHGNQHSPIVLSNITHTPPRMNHCGPNVLGSMSHPPGLQNTVGGQVSLRPRLSNYVHVSEPPNAPTQAQGFPPNVHYVAMHVSASFPPSVFSNSFLNHSVNKSQNCPPALYNNKPLSHADVPLLSAPHIQTKSVSQENRLPPCMPLATAVHTNRLGLGSTLQKPNVCNAPPSQCDPLMTVVPTSVSRTSDRKNDSSISTTNQICIKIKDLQNVAVQSRECSDVQSTEQVVPLSSVTHIQDKVGITSVSEEKSVKYKYPLCNTISFHPAPPGTESVADFEPSHLSSQAGTKSSQSLSESTAQEPCNSELPEAFGENIESNPEINVASEFTSSGGESQNSDVLNINMYSGQPGRDTDDLESREISCGPELQEMHSDSKNDSVIDFNVDKADGGMQSVTVTTMALSSHEFSEKKNTDFCGTSHDVPNSSLLANDSVIDQKEKVTQLPSAFIENKSPRSELENLTKEKKNCIHVQSKKEKQFVNTVLHSQDNEDVPPDQNFNLHNFPLFKVPNSFQQHDSGSVSMPIASPFPEGPDPLTESSISLNPAPPGTDPVTDVELLSSPHQLNVKSSQGNEEVGSQKLSEHLCKIMDSHQENVKATKVSTASTPVLVQWQEVGTGKSLADASCASSASNPLQMYNNDEKAEVRNDCKTNSNITCLTEYLVNKPLELNIDKANKARQSATAVNTGTENMEYSLSVRKYIDSSVAYHDPKNAEGTLSGNLGSQNPGYCANFKAELENNSQSDKMCCSLQNNLQFSQDNNTAHRNTSLLQVPLLPVNATSLPVVSSKTLKWHVPYNSNYLNPAPPGTEPVSEFQLPGMANHDMQRATQELCINARQEIVSSQSPKSNYENPEQSLEMGTQVTVTKESDVSSSLSPKLVSLETTVRVVNSNVCSIPKQVDIKGGGPVKSSDDYSDHSGKAYSVQELSNQEIQPSEKTSDEADSGNTGLNINSSSQRVKSKEHISDLEMYCVLEYCNKNTVNHSTEVIKSKYEIMDPDNVSEKKNKYTSDVRNSVEANIQQLPACGSVGNSLSNSTVLSTQSDIIHNFSPCFQSSSCEMYSSGPYQASAPSSFHQTFAKHKLTSHCSDFLNPCPPGTEPITDFQPVQNSASLQSMLVHSKESSQRLLSNKFDESTSKKAGPYLEDVHVTKEFTKGTNFSTWPSGQSQDNFLIRSVALSSAPAEEVSPGPSNVQARDFGVQELCSHSENVTETSCPSGRSSKPEISTSEKTAKNEMSVLTAPTTESEEISEGTEVSSNSCTMLGTET